MASFYSYSSSDLMDKQEKLFKLASQGNVGFEGKYGIIKKL